MFNTIEHHYIIFIICLITYTCVYIYIYIFIYLFMYLFIYFLFISQATGYDGRDLACLEARRGVQTECVYIYIYITLTWNIYV